MWWIALATVASLPQQPSPTAHAPDRVLAFRATGIAGRPVEHDRGAVGTWQLLRKLQTTGSVMHTTAHPDDEHAGMLTRLGRGGGHRTALLALNRGEGGANAIGPELFDALGVVREEELRLAGSHYGLDDLYFTTAVDYGFSKTLEEARRSWDFDAVLGDMVRVIRLNRPLVVVSRFHGSARDGHGHHQAAGVLTPLAVAAAADPSRFPEQIAREGLRPWRVRKLYRGGVGGDEPHHLTVDAGAYSPWLGDTYEAVGRYGVSLQRSQTAGRVRPARGPALYRYERLAPADGGDRETDPFSGLNTTVSGIFDLTGEPATNVLHARLRHLESTLRDALDAFSLADPSASVPALARGLDLTREILAETGAAPEAGFLLRIKERQIERAIVSALGIEVVAMARGVPDGVVVGDRAVEVEVAASSWPAAASLPVTVDSVAFPGASAWTPVAVPPPPSRAPVERLDLGTFAVTLDGATSVPYVHRDRIADNRYAVRDSGALHLAAPRPALVAAVVFRVHGTAVPAEAVVRWADPRPPMGAVFPTLAALPPVSVSVEPRIVVVPRGSAVDEEITVAVVNHDAGGSGGTLRLDAPSGVAVTPASVPFRLEEPGARMTATFRVAGAPRGGSAVRLRALATVEERVIDTEYIAVAHDDLERRVLDRPAATTLRVIEVAVPPGLDVGYVMGVGDEVPAAIEQLGATVRTLSADDLAAADLSGFAAIVIGTRAYAVRPDLVAHHRRLMEYAGGGGHLVVLYQTQEFLPDRMAPFPADLPAGAEEVSEETAPVRLLAPEHPLLAAPNRITAEDFDDWIEQRGSKFFASWSPEYVPLIETRDTGQPPQRGVWLSATVGRGSWTYVALALHRQLPYGVSGAYRILANLLALEARRP